MKITYGQLKDFKPDTKIHVF